LKALYAMFKRMIT